MSKSPRVLVTAASGDDDIMGTPVESPELGIIISTRRVHSKCSTHAIYMYIRWSCHSCTVLPRSTRTIVSCSPVKNSSHPCPLRRGPGHVRGPSLGLPGLGKQVSVGMVPNVHPPASTCRGMIGITPWESGQWCCLSHWHELSPERWHFENWGCNRRWSTADSLNE